MADSVVEDVMISKVITETWNNYKLEDGTTIKVKGYITSIKRTSKFDNFGEPFYFINSQPIMEADIPRTLWRKIEKAKSET